MSRLLLASTLFASLLSAGDIFGGATVQEIFRIRLDRGDDVFDSLMDAIRKHQIQDGALVSAVGSLQQCTFHAVTTLDEKPKQRFTTRKGAMEILNINGIVAAGEPHFHMTLSDVRGAFGGHLEKGCKVLYRAEFTLVKFAGQAVARKPNEAGVPMLQKQ